MRYWLVPQAPISTLRCLLNFDICASMQCPSCAHPFPWQESFARMVTCTSCHAVSLVGRDTLELTGKSATLASSTGPLYLGAQGEYLGTSFVVQGRVRYSYNSGFWDEWCLQFSNSKLQWVSEDDGEFTISHQRKTSITTTRFEKIRVGQRLLLGDSNYLVQEAGTAVCLGGEGQLPFIALPREAIEYKSLRFGTNRMATLELCDEELRLFTGRRIDPSILNIPDPIQPIAAPDGPTDGHTLASDAIEQLGCFCCAAPLEAKEGALQLTCSYCATVNDRGLPQVDCPTCRAHFGLAVAQSVEQAHCPKCDSILKVSSPGRPEVLVKGKKLSSKQKGDNKSPTGAPSIYPFKIGQRCTLQNVEYVLTGHMRSEVVEEGISYSSDSFILMSKSSGQLWLERENGHFVLNKRMNTAPTIEPHRPRKSKVPADNTFYKFFETGISKVTWVQGQFPYLAQVGDTSTYTDIIKPPYSICVEESDNEIEAFKGKYLQPTEVAAAFGMNIDKLDKPVGVAPSQPYILSIFRTQAKRIQLYTLLAMLLIVSFSGMQGKFVESFDVHPENYINQQEFQTEYFEVTESDTLVELEAFAGVDNSWVYLDMMLVDAAENRIHEFSTNISYYHGYEGGESWSEGSRSNNIYLKVKEPGQYKLVLTGEVPQDSGLWKQNGIVKLKLREGIWLTRFPWAVFLFSLFWTFWEIIAKSTFGAKRWGDDD